MTQTMCTDSEILDQFQCTYPSSLAEIMTGLYLCHRILGDSVKDAYIKVLRAHVIAATEQYFYGWLN